MYPLPLCMITTIHKEENPILVLPFILFRIKAVIQIFVVILVSAGHSIILMLAPPACGSGLSAGALILVGQLLEAGQQFLIGTEAPFLEGAPFKLAQVKKLNLAAQSLCRFCRFGLRLILFHSLHLHLYRSDNWPFSSSPAFSTSSRQPM